MRVVHRARISPLLPETQWTLEGEDLVERRGGRERRFQMSRLRRMSIAEGLARLDFPRARLRIPARSFASGVTIEDHGASFRALTEALAAEAAARAPSVRLGPSQPSGAELVVWTIGLFGLGALAMLAWSLLAGAWALGLALAARLAFVAILALAVLPWLARRGE
ncbi:MAG: hypothetical protein ACK4TR_14010 [Phenylobacterium sp.]|uniref:hypothetical protein n=1 Tax=Phenylobacterium sp. TaxID=1871053 RepID=UPI00391B3143